MPETKKISATYICKGCKEKECLLSTIMQDSEIIKHNEPYKCPLGYHDGRDDWSKLA